LRISMLVRSIPLAICMAWLAYESHFSVSFFQETVTTSLISISDGIEEALGGDLRSHPQVASAGN
jgi:hypothetical protein